MDIKEEISITGLQKSYKREKKCEYISDRKESERVWVTEKWVMSDWKERHSIKSDWIGSECRSNWKEREREYEWLRIERWVTEERVTVYE